MDVTELYHRFAEIEARDLSPTYRDWALGIAAGDELTEHIADLAGIKRQPNLVFAAARLLGAPIGGYPEFREWTLAHWPAVRTEILSRRTQTNEPRRCAILLPLLAALPQPLALLEVGASAGLGLCPDRYSYRYDCGPRIDPPTGPSPVELTVATTGPVPLPTRVPEVAWRAGLDLHPLDVRSAEDVAWLRTLIWPEQEERRRLLAAAVPVVAADPPRITAANLSTVEELAAEAPAEATLVVFHSAVLAYVDDRARAEFVRTVQTLPGHWISYEGERRADGRFVVSLDGEPVALAGGHGHTLDWLD